MSEREPAGTEAQPTEPMPGPTGPAGPTPGPTGPAGPMPGPTGPAGPTPEQIAERARRADKGTRNAMAAVLGLQMVVVLLIPRTIVFTTGLGPVRTGICFGVAALLLFGAAVTRRSWGIGVGSALQVVFTATGFLIGTMFVIGAIFGVIWLRLLLLRHEIIGTPGGLRLLVS